MNLNLGIYNYLHVLTEIQVFTGKSQTKILPYWPNDSKANTAR